MKRVVMCVVGIGVLASVGLLTVEQGFAVGNDGSPKCNVATLKGRYLFAAKGMVSPDQTEPICGQRRRNSCFQRRRHRLRFGDTHAQRYRPAGAYPQQLDLYAELGLYGNLRRTGTPLTFAIFVSPNGDEITTINTNPGASSS